LLSGDANFAIQQFNRSDTFDGRHFTPSSSLERAKQCLSELNSLARRYTRAGADATQQQEAVVPLYSSARHLASAPNFRLRVVRFKISGATTFGSKSCWSKYIELIRLFSPFGFSTAISIRVRLIEMNPKHLEYRAAGSRRDLHQQLWIPLLAMTRFCRSIGAKSIYSVTRIVGPGKQIED
jgi:hypothetical protein